MACKHANSIRLAPATESRERTDGFSLLELLIVISMSLVIAALAIPNAMTAIANVRLRSAANSVAGIIQDERIRAVKQNSRTALHTTTTNGARIMCVDENLNDACDATERSVQVPNTVTRHTSAPSGSGAPSVTVDSTAGLTSPQLASLPSFTARGIPCLFSGGACTNPGFVIYLSGTEPLGNDLWAAVTVSPSGRVKVWTWSGSAWSN